MQTQAPQEVRGCGPSCSAFVFLPIRHKEEMQGVILILIHTWIFFRDRVFLSESFDGLCETFSEDMDSLVFAFGSGSSLDSKIKNQQLYHLLTQQDSALKTERSHRGAPAPLPAPSAGEQNHSVGPSNHPDTVQRGAYQRAVGTPPRQPAPGGVSAGGQRKGRRTHPTS